MYGNSTEKIRIVKTTIAIPLQVSKEMNELIDKYDSTKCSSRQEFILSAIVEKLKTYYGKSTEDLRKTYGEDTEDLRIDTFKKFKGRFDDE